MDIWRSPDMQEKINDAVGGYELVPTMDHECSHANLQASSPLCCIQSVMLLTVVLVVASAASCLLSQPDWLWLLQIPTMQIKKASDGWHTDGNAQIVMVRVEKGLQLSVQRLSRHGGDKLLLSVGR